MNYRPYDYWFVALFLLVAVLGIGFASGSIPANIDGLALLGAFSH